MARLIIKGRDYGIHAFLTPLRDPTTHRPFPGVKIGDIGPKFGLNAVDNGFAKFEYYAIRESPTATFNFGVSHLNHQLHTLVYVAVCGCS